MTSVSGVYLYCIWKLNLNEYQNGVRVWSVSVLYLKIESEWVSEWHPCLERIWTVSKGWFWMSIRMASVSGVYLNCIKRLEFEWVSEWRPCLERIWTVIKGLNLNEYHNGFRVWSVSELYQKLNLNEYQNGFRVWSVFELYQEAESECIWKLGCLSWSSRYLSCLVSGINLWPEKER